MNITDSDVRAAVQRLTAAAEALYPVADTQPLSSTITDATVLRAIVAGAPPSPCEARVDTLLAGGLPGLRAFVHLATEVAVFGMGHADPFVADSELERRVVTFANDLQGEARVLARHRALFADQNGHALWLVAHADAIDAEQLLLQSLFEGLKEKVEPSLLFWYDPGTPQADIKSNATLLSILKRAPEAAKRKRPTNIKKAYARLLEMAPPLR